METEAKQIYLDGLMNDYNRNKITLTDAFEDAYEAGKVIGIHSEYSDYNLQAKESSNFINRFVGIEKMVSDNSALLKGIELNLDTLSVDHRVSRRELPSTPEEIEAERLENLRYERLERLERIRRAAFDFIPFVTNDPLLCEKGIEHNILLLVHMAIDFESFLDEHIK